MTRLVIEQDDREKRPNIFPRIFRWRPGTRTTAYEVEVHRVRLPTADVRLQASTRCGLELKRDVREIATNVFGDARRRSNFKKCLDRLAGEYEVGYLVLDMRIEDLCRSYDEVGCRPRSEYPYGLMGALLRETTSRGIRLMGPIAARTSSQRIYLGHILLDVMLAHEYGTPNIISNIVSGLPESVSPELVVRTLGK